MSDRLWTGVVLAGGLSSRMGRDKALIQVDGVALLDRVIDLLRPHCREVLVIADPTKYEPGHARVIADDRPGLGPAGGLATALRHARYVRSLVLACDLPNINDRLLLRLKQELAGDVDAVVPKHADFVEPLAAAYHRTALEALDRNIDRDRLKMSALLDVVNTHYLDILPGEDGWPVGLFRNLNSPADL